MAHAWCKLLWQLPLCCTALIRWPGPIWRAELQVRLKQIHGQRDNSSAALTLLPFFRSWSLGWKKKKPKKDVSRERSSLITRRTTEGRIFRFDNFLTSLPSRYPRRRTMDRD
ncbi:hypothetical protein H113_01647 [Trichophyton rubrum MR1459]|nr:hypothetical protein H113_01647 [Trichophyton rubrum MR1459]EZG09531.1 hypothetical protein H106_01415 [Trichophyton rubrum CBS 735.88]